MKFEEEVQKLINEYCKVCQKENILDEELQLQARKAYREIQVLVDKARTKHQAF